MPRPIVEHVCPCGKVFMGIPQRINCSDECVRLRAYRRTAHVSARISPLLMKRVKAYAAENGMQIQELAVIAVASYLGSRGF